MVVSTSLSLVSHQRKDQPADPDLVRVVGTKVESTLRFPSPVADDLAAAMRAGGRAWMAYAKLGEVS